MTLQVEYVQFALLDVSSGLRFTQVETPSEDIINECIIQHCTVLCSIGPIKRPCSPIPRILALLITFCIVLSFDGMRNQVLATFTDKVATGLG